MSDKTSTDSVLINKIKAGDEESLMILVDRHTGLYVDMTNQYAQRLSQQFEKNDFLQEKPSFFYECALQYDSKFKTKFSTFLANQIKWKFLNLQNSSKNHPTFSYNHQPICSQTECAHQKVPDKPFSNILVYEFDFIKEDIEKNDALCIIKDIISKSKDKRIRKIFKERYKQYKNKSITPWSIVSVKVGMSIQGCINLHNQTIKKIKKRLSNNGK